MSPLKPDHPLSVLSFHARGEVTPRFEHPPRTQEDLETAIGVRFAAQLQRQYDQRLIGLRRGAAEPADLEGELEPEGRNASIQIVEVIDPIRVRLRLQRWEYLQAFFLDHPDTAWRFAGFRLMLTDEGGKPFLPPASNPAGVQAVAELSAQLGEFAHGLTTLVPEKVRNAKIRIGGLDLHVSCSIRDYADGRPRIGWGGSRRFLRGEERDHLLAAIRGKINTHYAKPAEEF